jgi:hypothetical protein
VVQKKIMSSSSNPDIRREVEANRGFSKNLELLIPGLGTYRKLEDVRVADSILRNQVADKLDNSKSNLENLRKQMVANNDFANVSTVASLVFQIQQLSGEIRHAQQGYSGFVAAIQINQSKLDELYEYDFDFVQAAVWLQNKTSPTNLVYNTADPSSVQANLSEISNSLQTVKQSWQARMEAIENVLVK